MIDRSDPTILAVRDTLRTLLPDWDVEFRSDDIHATSLSISVVVSPNPDKSWRVAVSSEADDTWIFTIDDIATFLPRLAPACITYAEAVDWAEVHLTEALSAIDDDLTAGESDAGGQ